MAPVRSIVRTLAAAALTVALLSACADSGAQPASSPDPASPGHGHAAGHAGTEGTQHDADVAFAQMMLPHIKQGVELTDMVPARAGDPAVQRLVHTMNNAVVEEEGQLIGQLRLWRAPIPGENGVPLHTMPGMADVPTLDRLRTMTGPAFDQAWLTVMIAHHQGGADMSREYLARGSGHALETLARSQVEIGGRQIEQMRGLTSVG